MPKKGKHNPPKIGGTPQIPNDAKDALMETLGVPISVAVAIGFAYFDGKDGKPVATEIAPEDVEDAAEELEKLVKRPSRSGEDEDPGDVRELMDSGAQDEWAAKTWQNRVTIRALLGQLKRDGFSKEKPASVSDVEKAIASVESFNKDKRFQQEERDDTSNGKGPTQCQAKRHGDRRNDPFQPKRRYATFIKDGQPTRKVYQKGPLEGQEVEEGNFFYNREKRKILCFCDGCKRAALKDAGSEVQLYFQPFEHAKAFLDADLRREHALDDARSEEAGGAVQRRPFKAPIGERIHSSGRERSGSGRL